MWASHSTQFYGTIRQGSFYLSARLHTRGCSVGLIYTVFKADVNGIMKTRSALPHVLLFVLQFGHQGYARPAVGKVLRQLSYQS